MVSFLNLNVLNSLTTLLGTKLGVIFLVGENSTP